MSRRILFTAAHGGFAGQAVPLGGGATIFNQLIAEWDRIGVGPVNSLTPSILGSHAPSAKDIVRFTESDYAQFCVEFERACTEEILRYDPKDVTVLANDVSEGPDFARLGKAGYRIATIYHVDVVAYISDVYLRGWLAAPTTVKLYPSLRWTMPRIARLIWEKQAASVQYSQALIVPSSGMKRVMLDCYPTCPPDRIRVLPWGATPTEPSDPTPLREEFGIPEHAKVLLTLSRISPEKGIDRLLESLAANEMNDIWLFICGEPAFMKGESYARKVRALASKLRKIKVVFPGYVSGERKRQFFGLADVFVFPSTHESYGLTLMEALSAGLPAVCTPTSGALEIMQAGLGEVTEALGLADAIYRVLERPRTSAMREYAAAHPFSECAAELGRYCSEN